MAKILIVEDDLTFSKILEGFLKKNGHTVIAIHSCKDALEIASTGFDLAFFDYRLPDGNGLDLLQKVKLTEAFPVIIMTSFNDVRTAVLAIQWGASDYILKPVNPDELIMLVNKTLNVKPGKKQQRAEENYIEGEDAISKKLFEHVRLIAPTEMSVMITGESGTGKEYVARTIHNLSKRKDGPFVAVDCGTLSSELAASELFGHIKGSFTGAVADRVGSFEAANKGTLFLDEIGNLPYDVQIKLLRAVQERVVQRVGGNKLINVDVRIICATNEDLTGRAREGKFRDDLYHRINEFGLTVPALRERGNDLILFADLFREMAREELNRNAMTFSPGVLDIFRQYQWPGNLRELRNVVRRAVLFTTGDVIELSTIPPEMSEAITMHEQKQEDTNREQHDLKSLHEITERELITRTLRETNYNKTKTARLLNIDRKTLYAKMEKYGIG